MSLNKKEIAAVTLIKLLADERRFLACKLLARSRRGMTVTQLAEQLEMTHSATSHLLGVLHHGKVVSYARTGREIRYSFAATPEARRVTNLLAAA